MTWTAGFNFRATSGYVTDGTGETYSIGEAYPTTRSMGGGGASVTFGWSQNLTGNSRDRTTASPNAPELSGIVYTAAGAGAITFRVDLPAVGSYDIRCAVGDASFSQHAYFTVYDNTTPLISSTELITPANSFVDASLTTLTAANWQSSNTPVTKTFATTIANITMRVPSAALTPLAHFRLTASGGGAAFIAGPGLIINQAVARAANW